MKKYKLLEALNEAELIAESALKECEECYDIIEVMDNEIVFLQSQIDEADNEILKLKMECNELLCEKYNKE